MSGQSRFWAVIPAAGVGRRMGADRPKQYLPLAGRTVLEHTLEIFFRHPRVSGVVLAIAADDGWFADLDIVAPKPFITVTGGEERCHSVLNALQALRGLADPMDWVMVHDAARPCLSNRDLENLMDVLGGDPVGGILAVPVGDTVKMSGPQGRIESTVDRSRLWRAFTPQMFRLDALERGLRQSLLDGFLVTDDASAMEHVGMKPRLVEGSGDNIKITRPEDLPLAELYLSR